jgi:thymidylate synthase (FAD)
MENTNPWFIEGSSKARLVSHTPDPEGMMGYIARVTSKDQSNPNVERLLKYCAKHGHWSVFEQATMTVEVVTPLAIAVQLLRHHSFTFQQFSGRYEDQQWMSNHTEGLSSFLDLF